MNTYDNRSNEQKLAEKAVKDIFAEVDKINPGKAATSMSSLTIVFRTTYTVEKHRQQHAFARANLKLVIHAEASMDDLHKI
jgi:hypothetical protein